MRGPSPFRVHPPKGPFVRLSYKVEIRVEIRVGFLVVRDVEVRSVRCRRPQEMASAATQNRETHIEPPEVRQKE